MSTTRVTWSGTVTFEYEEVFYAADVTANADHWYREGRKYMPNGDPGYPTEDEIEDIEFEVEQLTDEDTGEVVTYTEDMYNDIESAIRNQAEWEEPEPPEPDDDYYEERAMARWEAECDRFDY